VLYALEREPFPSLRLGWRMPRRIRYCLDDDLPPGASHHQKIVVIDDAVAFVGGIDVIIRRWDTSEMRIASLDPAPESSDAHIRIYKRLTVWAADPAA
jgi:phospholipase D1/2